MEGRAANFEQTLAHFRSALRNAMYVAVDMELTGCDLPGEPDTYSDSAAERMRKLCRIAERHVPIQLGLTLVAREGEHFRCSTYNFYMFPHEDPEGQGTSFSCRPSALRFNAGHQMDFNAWINEGVSYMTREDEARYLGNPRFAVDAAHEQRAGLLRLWEAMCDAHIPLVVHSPLDLFFLLSSFERRRLPGDNPRGLAALVKQCFPCVFDTAYLHGLIGGFGNMKLTHFLEEARLLHEQRAWHGELPPISFLLERETAERYGNGQVAAHEAGYDSLATAQLYAYLIALAPDRVREGVNRLFLYQSVECLDLDRAEAAGAVGSCVFIPARETARVARLPASSAGSAVRALASRGLEYRRMDASHLLVVVRAPSDDAEATLAEVSSELGGDILRWLSLDQWRAHARRCDAHEGAVARTSPRATCPPEGPAKSASRAVSSMPAKGKALAWLDGSAEPRFTGAIKSYNPASGFGFVDCAATFAKFHRDVFLHHSQLGDCELGQQVTFEVALNDRGQPQAKAVRPLETDDGLARRLLAALCHKPGNRAEIHDGTTGYSSDVESNRGGSTPSFTSDSAPSTSPASS